jgi:thioredoxin-like negative regulator of GroEL
MKYPELNSLSRQELFSHEGVVLLLIHGPRCPPCVKLCTYLSQKSGKKTYCEIIEENLTRQLNDKVIISITEYNSEFKELINEQGIRSIPTIMVLKKGAVLGSFGASRDSAMNNFVDQLSNFIKI